MLFRRLAVFRGGWTLTAAEGVVTDAGAAGYRVLELLERLVRQSLVVADQAGGHTRYRMLETLRQYATGKLERAGEADSDGAPHAAALPGLGEQAETGLRGAAQARWLACSAKSTRTCGPRWAGWSAPTGRTIRPNGWPGRWACTGIWAGTWRVGRCCAG